jgi:hypothetical protein
MKKLFLFLINSSVLILLLYSCSTNSDPTDLIVRSSGVGEIVNIDSSSPNVSFRVLAGWTNSCGRLHHTDVTVSGQTYNIKVFGFQTKDEVCLAVMTAYEADININVQMPGNYTFKFWKSDGATLDTTLTIR